ncbi:MAG: 16S rRNA (guanine(966)-N(2))-methyltransferase RsmD [Acidobacteria bacterium]|nr:16S rRNA (guanine(966)-N(2))-methyltransferase RsmD [Acidobacteriota bacterium]MBK8315062.1 16S rRNA (guanine(966)-N(2))-methyltransferase RsmD [Acidobacteriota bacterium]
MRVISGLYKGRRLKTLEGLNIRPTSDRMRETLFNVLSPVIEDASFLDICAGSGAIGIEALSRGASKVTFVESSRKAVEVIRENLNHCGISEDVAIVNRDAIAAMKHSASEGLKFDIIYFDPPYASDIYSPVMWQIARNHLLSEDGILIAEHRRQEPLAPNYGEMRPYREIIQGESCLTFFRMDMDKDKKDESETID